MVEINTQKWGRLRTFWGRLVTALITPFRSPVVRVWRLGSLEHRLFPTQEAVDRLTALLKEVNRDDDLDVVWDSAIDVVELKGSGKVNIVTGPGIRVTRHGDVVKVEKEDE